MSDDEWNNLIGDYSIHLRSETVANLLRGNDTQCFTTEQYEEAYVSRNWKGAEEQGLKMFRDYDPDLSRKHLKSLGLKEIKPNVWIGAKQ